MIYFYDILFLTVHFSVRYRHVRTRFRVCLLIRKLSKSVKHVFAGYSFSNISYSIIKYNNRTRLDEKGRFSEKIENTSSRSKSLENHLSLHYNATFGCFIKTRNFEFLKDSDIKCFHRYYLVVLHLHHAFLSNNRATRQNLLLCMLAHPQVVKISEPCGRRYTYSYIVFYHKYHI